MKPREWVDCVVGVRDDIGDEWSATIRRAWRRKRDGALTRVVLVWGKGEMRREYRRRVVSVERVASGELAGLRVLVLGGAWWTPRSSTSAAPDDR